MTEPRWGIVATVKAPMAEILGFAAHHLDLGAHRLYIYLDEDAPETEQRLAAHPKIRVKRTGPDYWARRNGRPEKHQSRQFVNTRNALSRPPEVDWLAHIDVDEFLWPDSDLAAKLAALPEDCLCARIRPIEALADPGGGAGKWFKALHLSRPERQAAAERVFPTWGRYLPGGFLSHVAGKLFVRTGRGLKLRIHNCELGGVQNPGERPLPGTELCHLHAGSWEDWIAAYRYRLAHGSYRAELNPQVPQNLGGGLSHHDLFRRIEAEGGEAALRAFYDEVCVATPERRAALKAEGLLRHCDLDLPARIARHFPG
ncbi:MAG: glycosyltransferase family 2 protein [Paracoccaceae bacterium]